MDPVQLTVFGRLLYTLFLRRFFKKAVENSSNTIDDTAFKMVDEVVFGKKG